MSSLTVVSNQRFELPKKKKQIPISRKKIKKSDCKAKKNKQDLNKFGAYDEVKLDYVISWFLCIHFIYNFVDIKKNVAGKVTKPRQAAAINSNPSRRIQNNMVVTRNHTNSLSPWTF